MFIFTRNISLWYYLIEIFLVLVLAQYWPHRMSYEEFSIFWKTVERTGFMFLHVFGKIYHCSHLGMGFFLYGKF